MLQGYPTKKGTGITIYGDYFDLSSLYRTLHKVCETNNPSDNPPIVQVILNLAYEVRQSFSRNRLEETIKTLDESEKVEYLGFNYLWTDLLITLSAIRCRASYVVLNELDQSNLFLLEHITKDALDQFDTEGGARLKLYINQRIEISQPLLLPINEYINIQYLNEKPTKTRFRKLNKYFSYLSSYHPKHQEVKNIIEKLASSVDCPPEELSFSEENFPELKW